MSEPTVWLISSGSYSDYSVAYAAGSEELAERIAAELNARSTRGYGDYEYEVEYRPLFTEMPEVWTRFHVFARWTEDFEFSEGPAVGGGYSTETVLGGMESKRPKVHRFSDTQRHVTVAGADPEECKKVIYDRIALLKAEAAGLI